MFARFIRHHIIDGVYLVADHYSNGAVDFRLKYRGTYSTPYATEQEAVSALSAFQQQLVDSGEVVQ